MRNFCPGLVPGGILRTTRRPSSVLTLILEPSSACARFTGTVHTMSSPPRRDAERDRDRGLDLVLVVRASPALRTTPAEDAREQVSQPAERAEIRQIEIDSGALRPGPRAPRPARSGIRAVAAHLVVALALRGIAQHVLRFVDLLEALGRLSVVGIAIGMVLLGEPPKRLLDLIHRRRLRDPEDLVIVLRRGHQPLSPRGRGDCAPPSCGRPSCQVSTVTRAGRISAPLS